MPDVASAPAAQRNVTPILEALRQEFRDRRFVLEIGSGSGEHAVWLATELTHLDWQTSDLAENHRDIERRIAASGLSNIRAPLLLDVRNNRVSPRCCDAVFTANTAHIMSLETVERMFDVIGDALRPGGVVSLYGPFRIGGRFNSPSNKQFDASLRRRDPVMGIRDLEAVDGFAREQGLHRARLYAMPANNFLVMYEKPAEAP